MPPIDLAQLYDAHAEALFAFLWSFTGREEEASEVLQEVFVKVARNPEILVGARDARAYLIRLARNQALDLGRRRSVRDRYHEASAQEIDWFAPSEDPDRQAFQESLTAALKSLPEDQREVVHLKLWEGMTFDGIAELLSIPLNTAASRYRYGIDKLRDQLRPLYEEIQ